MLGTKLTKQCNWRSCVSDVELKAQKHRNPNGRSMPRSNDLCVLHMRHIPAAKDASKGRLTWKYSVEKIAFDVPMSATNEVFPLLSRNSQKPDEVVAHPQRKALSKVPLRPNSVNRPSNSKAPCKSPPVFAVAPLSNMLPSSSRTQQDIWSER